jgi:hypothetical protein
MIWVGSFKSLQTVLGKHRFTGAPLDVHTWVRSEIALISPPVDWLMNLIATSHCVCGEEQLVEFALREALSNAMLHGNRLETGKLIHVHCRCEPRREFFVVVSDQGRGFDPNQIPKSIALEIQGLTAPGPLSQYSNEYHTRTYITEFTGKMHQFVTRS